MFENYMRRDLREYSSDLLMKSLQLLLQGINRWTKHLGNKNYFSDKLDEDSTT